MERNEPRASERRPAAPEQATESARDARTGRSAAAGRIGHQAQWVELQLREAVARGDFDDLPGYGKPIEGLGAEHDPDWWVKKLVEREQVTVLPPALTLRTEDAGLDDRLDRLGSERDVRRELVDFNDRVRHTLYSNPGGPPVITPQRDIEQEVSRWQERRARRRAAELAARSAGDHDRASQRTHGGLSRWWPRRRPRPSS